MYHIGSNFAVPVAHIIAEHMLHTWRQELRQAESVAEFATYDTNLHPLL
jgi:hypothetical protein